MGMPLPKQGVGLYLRGAMVPTFKRGKREAGNNGTHISYLPQGPKMGRGMW